MLSWEGISLLSACSPIQHIPDAAIISASLDLGGGYLWYVGRHKGWGIWTKVNHSWEIEPSQQMEVLAQHVGGGGELLPSARSFTDLTPSQFICAHIERLLMLRAELGCRVIDGRLTREGCSCLKSFAAFSEMPSLFEKGVFFVFFFSLIPAAFKSHQFPELI